MKTKLECGCEIEVRNEAIKDCDSLPSLHIDFDNIKLDCPRTWALFCEGDTKGIFQLEKNLGQQWSKKVQPTSIGDAAALISIIRPGTLESRDKHGKSMAENYVDRRNGIEPQYDEEEQSICDKLEHILGDTHNIIIYQEQAMKIAVEIGGFDGQEADVLRKAIGKKKPELMKIVRENFLTKCTTTGIVTDSEALAIFDIIEKSQRYSFNKSHAVAYALMGYHAAYTKAHYPLHYICSWLYYSAKKQDEQEEVSEVFSDAKIVDVNILPPYLTSLFCGDEGDVCIKDGKVYLGMRNIKKVGMNHIKKMIYHIPLVEKRINKMLCDWTWYEFLTQFSSKVSSTVIIGAISAGGLDYMKLSRHRMLYEYETIWCELTKKEQEYISTNLGYCTSLQSALAKMLDNQQTYMITKNKDMKSISNVNRVEKIGALLSILANPPTSLKDSPEWIVATEHVLLGTPISISRVDTCTKDRINMTCMDFKKHRMDKGRMGVEIKSFREHKITKKGKMKNKIMGFLSVEDNSCKLDAVIIFPDTLIKCQNLLYADNTVLLTGRRSDRDGFIVEKVQQLV